MGRMRVLVTAGPHGVLISDAGVVMAPASEQRGRSCRSDGPSSPNNSVLGRPPRHFGEIPHLRRTANTERLRPGSITWRNCTKRCTQKRALTCANAATVSTLADGKGGYRR